MILLHLEVKNNCRYVNPPPYISCLVIFIFNVENTPSFMILSSNASPRITCLSLSSQKLKVTSWSLEGTSPNASSRKDNITLLVMLYLFSCNVGVTIWFMQEGGGAYLSQK